MQDSHQIRKPAHLLRVRRHRVRTLARSRMRVRR